MTFAIDNQETRWPSFLKYLGLGSIFSNLPPFDQTQPLFVACVSTMHANTEKEVLFYMYDRLFAEVLTQIKNLPEINAPFLLQAIEQKRKTPSFLEAEKVPSALLTAYETAFKEKSADTIHDLVLYLAWDRMCVWMGSLFNFQSANPKFIQGISHLKECLIESYHHIAQQGKTSPGTYRLIEALIFYQMREENLQKHSAEDWALLNQSFRLLKNQDELVEDPLDSPEDVQSYLALAQLLIGGKSEVDLSLID